jgi:hypothetical protein
VRVRHASPCVDLTGAVTGVDPLAALAALKAGCWTCSTKCGKEEVATVNWLVSPHDEDEQEGKEATWNAASLGRAR